MASAEGRAFLQRASTQREQIRMYEQALAFIYFAPFVGAVTTVALEPQEPSEAAMSSDRALGQRSSAHYYPRVERRQECEP